MSAGHTKTVCAKVKQREFDEFVRYFPQHGALTWFIRESLHHFNRTLRSSDPEVVRMIGRTIVEANLDSERPHVDTAAGDTTAD